MIRPLLLLTAATGVAIASAACSNSDSGAMAAPTPTTTATGTGSVPSPTATGTAPGARSYEAFVIDLVKTKTADNTPAVPLDPAPFDAPVAAETVDKQVFKPLLP